MQSQISAADILAVALGRQGFDDLKITGLLNIVLRGPDGRIKTQETVKNLVVTAGRNHIADQLSDAGQAAMSHMAIGTGTTAADTTNTALETELDRNALTSITQGTGSDAHKVTYVADWAAGDGTGAITEAGIFNSASAGDMLCRSVFAVKNKGAGDTLTMTWVLTISA
jgi:uncharacterized protein YidB (DUF937 family)